MSETVDSCNVLSSISISELLIPTVNWIGSTLDGIELIVYKLCVLCEDVCMCVQV